MQITTVEAPGLPSTSKMDVLLSCFLQNPDLISKFHIPRFQHRLALMNEWHVRPNERILDIGCGQGESCLALALAVGKGGHVTGIDTAPPDYGSPFTMREAHDYIRQSVLGSRVTFQSADTPTFLHSLSDQPSTVLDSAVLCHSLWYFPNDKLAQSLFATLAEAKISRIYLAEYSYTPCQESQIPHVLAAKAQALFYRYKAPKEPDPKEQNVRAGLDQESILRAAYDAGFDVARKGHFTPPEDMLEGQFEVDHVLGKVFPVRIAAENLEDSQEAEIRAYIEQVRSETARLKSRGNPTIRSMDVWWVVLELNE
ncbi:hypothetical protein ACN42_g7269 [Penicillium freii]|uniref:Methyltransferase domain-containing protein n=1 Tax=Penicillium freii TaxID=48697 RepID=A0A101MFW9_PENFR|nr:hypothetical protein ACN42_g7269 [Penicillium freii]